MSDGSPMARWRRRTAMVMAAMLAVALVPLAGPAGAQPAPPPDIEPSCGHVGSAGFTDIGGTGFEDVIDCLAAFGVTTGTSGTEYSPAVQVRRSQMALFYHRVGDELGLVFDTSDAGFSDLDGLDPAFVDAINAMANEGIVQGTSPGEFSPQDRIRRSQMALFIDRFQDRATGYAYSDGFSGSDLFDDIGSLGAEARGAVNGIGSVGITQGDGAGSYGPSGFVSRQQMAAFVVRHLAEIGLTAPGSAVSGNLVDYDSGDSYTVSDGDQLVDVDIEPGDTFSISGGVVSEADFETALASSTTGLGHVMDHDSATGEHDVTPLDDDMLAAHGFVVGSDLFLNVVPIEASIDEPVSGVTMVDSAEVGWDDIDAYRVDSVDATESEFRDEVSFGDTVSIAYVGGDRTVWINNGAVSGPIGDETNIGFLDPGVEIGFQVDFGAFVGGNDLVADDSFVLTRDGYDDGVQEYTVDGSLFDYDDIEDLLVNGYGGQTIGELIDDGLSVEYYRTGGVEHFDFSF
ncbi:MAG: S-layer homology domain-containing protein [Acidimicrobiales bacterium]|nr:S-layer homology domain-containing protein [Acidimicrobiales bacterium]